MKFVILFLHVCLGMAGTFFSALALHHLKLNNNAALLRWMRFEFFSSVLCTFFAALYYLQYYQPDKHILTNGKFPMAHFFMMEVKEHSFIFFILLSLYFQLRLFFSGFRQEEQFVKESEVVIWCLIILSSLMSLMGLVVNFGFRINQ